jgi:hypothetical protein
MAQMATAEVALQVVVVHERITVVVIVDAIVEQDEVYFLKIIEIGDLYDPSHEQKRDHIHPHPQHRPYIHHLGIEFGIEDVRIVITPLRPLVNHRHHLHHQQQLLHQHKWMEKTKQQDIRVVVIITVHY